eukprot:SAG31_NODE_3651_length_4025_cov_3.433520_2_plen_113_part_00
MILGTADYAFNATVSPAHNDEAQLAAWIFKNGPVVRGCITHVAEMFCVFKCLRRETESCENWTELRSRRVGFWTSKEGVRGYGRLLHHEGEQNTKFSTAASIFGGEATQMKP